MSAHPRPSATLDAYCPGGLYRPEFERDSCGFGLIAQMDGQASHWLVQTAIDSLACLTHRGAVAPDGKTGDGCGLLLGLPDRFLRAEAHRSGFELGSRYAVGMLFLHRDTALANRARSVVREELTAAGLTVQGFRPVPVDPEACGEEALKSRPTVEQVFANAPPAWSPEDTERRLYVARRRLEKRIEAEDKTFYVASLSCRVLSYKGLVMPGNLPVFYPDLRDPAFEAPVCLFHQRFSTNTWPEWRLAQPFRHLAHNGEINTIQGNRLWSIARSYTLAAPGITDMEEVRPLVSMTGSDSLSLDNMLDALVAGGIDYFRAVRLLIPPAWQNVTTMDPDLRAFYEYHSMHMEPWDGPAGIVLTDGRRAGCVMDRNGLRPARWLVTRDRHFTIASETGVHPYAPADVVAKGRLKPGEMIAVDIETGELLLPQAIDDRLKRSHPYRQWLHDHTRKLEGDGAGYCGVPLSPAQVSAGQKLFQVTFEECDQILRVLAEDGQEAVGSMGDDTPMAVLSRNVRSPYEYFRQQFAQVTNPPIDPLREQVVMSLNTCLGPERNLFETGPEHARRLEIPSPVLSRCRFATLLALDEPTYRTHRLDLTYGTDDTLAQVIARLADEAVAAVRAGAVILVLSDRAYDRDRLPAHALFATGAVHHALVRAGLRCNANLVVETATARDPHHFACLIGYGATAIFPYLAYETLAAMARANELAVDEAKAIKNYRKGINKGLLKIISKMGISTIASYRGAQLFEAIGVDQTVIERSFVGTPSRIGGATFADFDADQRRLAAGAFNPNRALHPGGLLKYIHGGEYHAYHPDVVRTLQEAVRSGEYRDYEKYARIVNERPVTTLRDLLAFRTDTTPIPLSEVESVQDICKRFDSAGMSLGALSPEAHEALAEAMNTLGGRSNSGEGGEDPRRYGTIKTSRIKQVASGRFGVTPHYLVHADTIQIKIAQGAKPGEGGQLPGHKVNDLIARLRCSKPGVALISPPPHHDIYSIEDLAQLIFDLKQVNPEARVSVKLVSGPGVGTIAAGVAKAYADHITIAGYDGGTGASPLTSVKYAGTPWELGLSETHQTLRANHLREKVILQTDGGLKTGLDVVKATILGAESYGFGTGPMIALGCKYLRICHLNNCATGIATQDARLRASHFKGLPSLVINYFRFIAEEVRQWMASLGVRTIDELIGRVDLLAIRPGETDRQRRLDLSQIISDAGVRPSAPRHCQVKRNQPFDRGELAEQMVTDAHHALVTRSPVELRYPVRNVHRSLGARLSGEIAKRHGAAGLPDGTIRLVLAGSAGQSLGAWNARGLDIDLTGDANDYVGKGMSGGRIVIRPPADAGYPGPESAIIGNTCLYGATGGRLYAAGLAGERFAVRNGGAFAIVEGVGDHGCEYMTGGAVLILGPVGLNFGAGMTGGFSFVHDEDHRLPDRINAELVDAHRISSEPMSEYRAYLRERIAEHALVTGSVRARALLDDWERAVPHFWLVKPKARSLDGLLAESH